MSANAIFVADFHTTDNQGNTKVTTSKLAVDINDHATLDFLDVFNDVKAVEDGDIDDSDDAQTSLGGNDYDSVEDLILDHPDYFSIRWFDNVGNDDATIEIENMIAIRHFI